jgi:Na+/alanine symporter
VGHPRVVPSYFIPTWAATWILIIGTCVSISLLLKIIVTIATGEFTPVAAVGGILGADVHTMIKALVVSLVRKEWAADLEPVLRLLQAVR